MRPYRKFDGDRSFRYQSITEVGVWIDVGASKRFVCCLRLTLQVDSDVYGFIYDEEHVYGVSSSSLIRFFHEVLIVLCSFRHITW